MPSTLILCENTSLRLHCCPQDIQLTSSIYGVQHVPLKVVKWKQYIAKQLKRLNKQKIKREDEQEAPNKKRLGVGEKSLKNST